MTETRAIPDPSDARFRRIFDCAGVGIAITDMRGRFVETNPAFSEVIGYGPDELRRLSFPDLTHRDDRRKVEAAVGVLRRGTVPSRVVETRATARDGSTRHLRSSLTLMRDTDGAPTHVMGTVEDVTWARRTSEHLERSRDLLQHAEEERQRLQQHVLRVQRMASLGSLASGLTHDLGNALALVQMGVHALAGDEADLRRRAMMEGVERSARRASEMLERLLLFVRGQEQTQQVPVDVGDLVTELGHLVSTTFPRSIAWQDRVPAGLWGVTGDPTHLHQVMMNLCVNARDAMPSGGLLTVAADNVTVQQPRETPMGPLAPGPYVVVSVTDTGAGMTPEEVAAAMEPFATTKATGSGSGLGLPTACTIVERHGGVLVIDSAPGRGTTAEVYLPSDLPPGTTPPRTTRPDR